MDNEAANNQTSLLDESIIDTTEYDKKLKKARTTIFVVAVIQLLLGVFLAFIYDGLQMYISVGITAVIALVFVLLGLWCKSKPLTAIIIALSLYVVLWLADAYFDPTLLFKGIIVKIVVISYFVKELSPLKKRVKLKKVLM